MADAAVILFPDGKASVTNLDPANRSTSTQVGAKKWISGPPLYAAPNMISICEVQVASTDTGQTANTYRWVADLPNNASSPTTWNYFGNAFVSIGGI